MVVPYQHSAELNSINATVTDEMMQLASKCITALKAALCPDGFNVGMNIGKIAGAGIDDHLHLHIVPRWSADTNFMPIISHTKVISEGLWETWEKIKRHLQ
jgi:ATP adenylyltransferase